MIINWYKIELLQSLREIKKNILNFNFDFC